MDLSIASPSISIKQGKTTLAKIPYDLLNNIKRWMKK
jgi:hypothetical protein